MWENIGKRFWIFFRVSLIWQWKVEDGLAFKIYEVLFWVFEKRKKKRLIFKKSYFQKYNPDNKPNFVVSILFVKHDYFFKRYGN